MFSLRVKEERKINTLLTSRASIDKHAGDFQRLELHRAAHRTGSQVTEVMPWEEANQPVITTRLQMQPGNSKHKCINLP